MVNTTTGIAARGALGNPGAGWVWDAHETHDRIPAADSWTFITLIQRYGAAGARLVFGYGVDTATPDTDMAGMWGDSAERLRPVVGTSIDTTAGTWPLGTSVLSIVRWDGATLEGFKYGLDGQLVGTNSSAESTNVSTGGQVGINYAADTLGGASHDYTVAYAWDRHITDAEIRLLLDDPYGPIRMADPSPSGLTVSLFATATGTITAVVDETDATSDIHLSVDDDPASPTDADWMNSSVDIGQIFLGLTDMPAAFGNADTADIVVRYRGQVWVEGSLKLFVQLFQSNESTSLSNEVEVVTVSGDSSYANTSVTITGVDTGASKGVWDAAVVRFRWGVS